MFVPYNSINKKYYIDLYNLINIFENCIIIIYIYMKTVYTDGYFNISKKYGADKHETYSCIINLHHDIVIPHHGEIDKEAAGIPSELTNVI